MPSSTKAKHVLFAHLPNYIEGTIYELGCGWGSLLFPLSRKYPLNSIVGVESSPIPFCFTKGLSWLLSSGNVDLFYQDFFHISLHEAGLIICYLYPGAMNKLKEKFEKELAPGTWIISNTFAIPGWTPYHIYEVGDLYHSKIYFYKKGCE